MNKSLNFSRNATLNTILEWLGTEFLDADQDFIRCPGEHFHTTATRLRDCKLYSNQNGTIVAHCWHQSCRECVNQFNAELFRSVRGAGKLRYFRGNALESSRGNLADRTELLNVQQGVRDALPKILRSFDWPYAAIASDSPEAISMPVKNHWYYILNLFEDGETVWIGRDVYDSGSAGHRWRFRSALKWMEELSCPGMFICPSLFKTGVHSRSDKNVLAPRFLVVESDELDRNQVGAIFRWIELVMGLRLRAVVDTAGKSLHGWFDYPSRELLEELKIALPLLGCDPALFKPSQPCRLPGKIRDGKYQTLIYVTQ